MSLDQTLIHLNQRKTRLVSELDIVCSDFKDSIPDELLQFRDLLNSLVFKLDIPEGEEVEKTFQLLNYNFINLSSSLKDHFTKKREDLLNEGPDTLKVESADNSKLRDLNQKIAFCEMILGKVKLESAPIMASLDPSVKCNYRCRVCHHSVSQKNKIGSLSESVLANLDPLLKRLMDLHIFGGGEPTLSYAMGSLAYKIKEHGVHADILTNGSNFNFLLERIKKFRSEFPDIEMYFNVTLNKVNFNEVVGIVKLAIELGINTVQFNKMHVYYDSVSNLEIDIEDREYLREAFNKAREICGRSGIRFLVSLDLDSLPPRRFNDSKDDLLKLLESSPAPTDDIYLSLENAISETRMTLLKLSDAFRRDSDPTERSIKEDYSSDEALLESILLNLEEEVKNLDESELSLPTCLVPWVRANIRTDGTVRPCAIMNDTMGCVESEKGFKAVWNSDKYVELRSSHVPAMNKEPCETCKKCAYVERGIRKEEVLGYFKELKEGLIIAYKSVDKPNSL